MNVVSMSRLRALVGRRGGITQPQRIMNNIRENNLIQMSVML